MMPYENALLRCTCRGVLARQCPARDAGANRQEIKAVRTSQPFPLHGAPRVGVSTGMAAGSCRRCRRLAGFVGWGATPPPAAFRRTSSFVMGSSQPARPGGYPSWRASDLGPAMNDVPRFVPGGGQGRRTSLQASAVKRPRPARTCGGRRINSPNSPLSRLRRR